jgi:hypothetical protein
MARLEEPMEFISLARAAEISGVAHATLRQQAGRKRLRTVQIARNHLTTRTWLHEYLMAREGRQGPRKPLPPDYVVPGKEG